MPPRSKPPARPAGIPKATVQRLAIGFLVLAGFDLVAGQRTLAYVCAGLAIVMSLGAGAIARAMRKPRSGR